MYRFNNSIYNKKLRIQRLIVDKSVKHIGELLPDFKYYQHIVSHSSNFARIFSVILHKHCLLDNDDFIGDTVYRWRDLFVFLDCVSIEWCTIVNGRPMDGILDIVDIDGHHPSLFKLAALVFLDRSLTIELFEYVINQDIIDENLSIFITLLYNMCSTSSMYPEVEKLFTSEEQISLFHDSMITISTIVKFIKRTDVSANCLLDWMIEYGVYIPNIAKHIDLNCVGEIELSVERVFRILRFPHEYKLGYDNLDIDIRDWLLGNANTKDWNTLMYIRLSELAKAGKKLDYVGAGMLTMELLLLSKGMITSEEVTNTVKEYIDVDLLQPLLITLS